MDVIQMNRKYPIHSPLAFYLGGPFGMNPDIFTNVDFVHFKLKFNEVLQAGSLSSKKTHPKEFIEVTFNGIFG